ncbi:LTA synthase family protein [Clostridium sp. A1-XYC3]|uniref:LTA synthase family protein n=1 Tax=Clostridium tanneri TaxID=3037988 RepID=A0ABU4JNP4_9CLOT|nr:LTA synthase family protein [Clostridium sp. A1-XYC3]MDW8799760.1 LTA synthase family protein [Clostridium sp. A1-XYC3]
MKKVSFFMNAYIDLFLFVLFITIKILVYGSQMQPDYFSYAALLPPVLASVLILSAISLLFKNKFRIKFLYICNLLITLFIIGDLTYFRYFKDVISIPVLVNGVALGAVKSSVASLIKLTDFLYAADLLLMVPFIRGYRAKDNLELPKKLRFSLLMICLIIGLTANIKSFYSLSKEQPRLLSTMYNKVYITRKLGAVNYHSLDLYNSISAGISRLTPLSNVEEKEIRTFLQTNSREESNLKGAAKGKNLIMIQVEALQGFVIDSKVNGEEITPNLNKLAKNSVYFNNIFYQTAAGGTSDAEFMTNNSLYPASSGAAYFLYAGNEFNGMPENFKEAGYDTAALHGFTETFWNRNVMYKKLGFNNFYGEKSYTVDETVGLGLSDKSFLNQAVEKIKTLNKPYYSFLITLSSHFPYDDPSKYGTFNVASYEGTLLGNYMKSIHYTDEQLGIFFDKLDKEGILKDSVVVLYGDHYAIPKEQINQLSTFLNKSSLSDIEWAQLQKVPLIIHFPNESPKGVNDIYAGQIDIYPTLCNLFSLPNKGLMGRDLFNSKEEKVVFRDGSFTDGKYYYMAQTNTYYNLTTYEKVRETEILKKKKDDVINQLEYSDDILKHNLLKKFKSEDK